MLIWVLTALAACSGGSGDGGVIGQGAAFLDVSPDEGFETSGVQGGSFFPNSKTYMLLNRGGESLDWSAASTAPGVSLSPSGGVLDSGAIVIVTLSLDSDALGALLPGKHVFALDFTNLTNGGGSLSMPVAITVNASGELAVTPSTGFPSSGPEGGPFDPLARDYTLTNLSGADIAWTVTTDAAWLAASTSTGVLAPGAQATVGLEIDPAAAAQLPAGSHLARALIRDLTNGADTEILVTLDITQPPTLVVWSSGGFDTSGPAGGPFNPASKSYTLLNSGSGSLDWETSVTEAWARVTPSSGSLAAGESGTVTVSIDAPATASLADGSFVASVAFRNATNDRGNTSRNVTLDIFTPQAILVVSPAGGLNSSGADGGPFSPSSESYSLGNTGNTVLAWSASSSVAWVTLSATSGSLQPAGQGSLEVRIDAVLAGALTPGVYNGLVSIVNETSGVGNTSRSIRLDVIAAGSGPILVPGTGFGGPTAQPPAIGGGPGSNAKVIGRWDVVPYQKIEDDFLIGVVAFHRNDVERVEFSLEGGPWTAVTTPSMNPSTGVNEYCAIVREQSLGFGAFEVRAIAYPHVGVPRVLDSLFLFADPGDVSPSVARWVSPSGNDSTGNGTAANPFRTIFKAGISIQSAMGSSADGGTIYMLQGSHAYGPEGFPALNTVNTWLTIQPAPGLTKANVSITSSTNPGLNTRLVHLKDLTVRTLLYASTAGDQQIWYEDCLLAGNGPETSVHDVGWYYGFSKRFLTDCDVEDNAFGPRHATLLRNVHCRRLGEDVFNQPYLILNCSADQVDAGSQASWHPDCIVFDNFSISENFIIYGLKVTNAQAQGLYVGHGIQTGRSDNIAFVNLTMEVEGSSGWISQWEVPSDHVLLWHCNFVGHSFGWRTPQSTLTNMSLRGNVFQRMMVIPTPVGFSPGGDSVDPGWFAHNHYVDPSGIIPGSDVSTGAPGFVNQAADDYHLVLGSPLRNRLAPLAPVDQDMVTRSDPTSIGVFD